MSTAANLNPQQRLNILFKNRPLPVKREGQSSSKEPTEHNESDNVSEYTDTSGITAFSTDQKARFTSCKELLSSATESSGCLTCKTSTPNVSSMAVGNVLNNAGEGEEAFYLSSGEGASSIMPQDWKEEDELHREPQSSSTEITGRYCLFGLTTKFVYKYMKDPGDRVSKQFFAAGKIFARAWKLHYLYSTDSTNSKPIMLVPYDQVEALVQDINKSFVLNIGIPPYPFSHRFHNDGTPQPVLLGQVSSKEDVAKLQANIPSAPIGHGSPLSHASAATRADFGAWTERVTDMLALEKGKKVSKASKNRVKLASQVKCRGQILERVQQYLGLRADSSTGTIRSGLNADSPVGTQMPGKRNITELDLSQPAIYPFAMDSIFISIDTEANEACQSQITEVGISTLDTRELHDSAPGQGCKNWISKIRSRHFRVDEAKHVHNTRFVYGNPDAFQYGVSEFIRRADLAEAIDSCFDHPYSAGYECAGPPEIDENHLPISHTVRQVNDGDLLPGHTATRNLQLVGHDTGADLQYFSDTGSTIICDQESSRLKSMTSAQIARRRKFSIGLCEILDTAVLHKLLRGDSNPRSLVRMCDDLGIEAWHPHNAGNDARYTLEALLKIAFAARQTADRKAADTEKTRPAKTIRSAQLGSDTPVCEVSPSEPAAINPDGNSDQRTAFLDLEIQRLRAAHISSDHGEQEDNGPDEEYEEEPPY